MLDYLKETFKQFTNNVISLGDDEITNHYSKLQSQADRGLLDEQLLKITPHNDPADLFEEFYKISLVNEEEPKPRYTDEEKIANISGTGRKFYNNLTWQTMLKLITMDVRQIWSDKSISILDGLANSENFKEDNESAKKSKFELDDKKLDYLWEDDNFFWYWLANGCVQAMIATHYRVLSKTGMRTINALQTRNIGELLVGSLNMEWSDEIYKHLGNLAMTAVVLGDLPLGTKFEINKNLLTGLPDLGQGPKGTYFQAATLIPAENAQPIFDKVKVPKEPNVGISMLHLESETLYWVFCVVKIFFPKVGEKGWIENNGYSL